MDLTTSENCSEAVEHAAATFGRIDAVVNNAGIVRDRTLVNMTPQEAVGKWYLDPCAARQRIGTMLEGKLSAVSYQLQ